MMDDTIARLKDHLEKHKHRDQVFVSTTGLRALLEAAEQRSEVTNERWAEHSTIMSLKGELIKAQDEARTLRNASLDLLARAETAEAQLKDADKAHARTLFEFHEMKVRAETAEKERDEEASENQHWYDLAFYNGPTGYEEPWRDRAKKLEAVLERIANESMDYQYVARAALEAKP